MSVTSKALDAATQITAAWVAAAGAGEDSLPAAYTTEITPESVANMFETVYKTAYHLVASPPDRRELATGGWRVE